MNRRVLKILIRCGFWLALAIAYVCAILPGGPQLPGGDKDTHILAFTTLAVLARWGWSKRRVIDLAVALVGFGILIELSQVLPIIHRDAEIMDVVADAIGTAIGLGSGMAALWLLRRRDQFVRS